MGRMSLLNVTEDLVSAAIAVAIIAIAATYRGISMLSNPLSRANYIISSSDDLNADSFGIHDMKPSVQIVFRIGSAFFQHSRHGFLVEFVDADREVIHHAH